MRKNGPGIAGFILALIGLIVCLIPLLGIVGIWFSGIGFILSLVGLFLKNRKKGLALVGLILAIVGPILYFVITGSMVANM